MNEDKINFLNNIDFENSDIVYETVASLYEENQQLKDVIDKAIKYINDNSWYFNDEDSGAMFCLEEETFCNDLLSILKEVE